MSITNFLIKYRRFIIVNLLLIIMADPIIASVDKDEVSANIELSKNSFYAGEIIIATVSLTCKDSGLAFLKELPSLNLSRGKFAEMIQINQPITAAYTDQNKDKISTKYILGKYAVSVDNPGKNKIESSDIITGINFPVIQNHPFWGRIESYRTEECILKIKPVSINVMNLPDNKTESPYSGVIGNFKINTVVPRREYVVNEENTIYIVVEGEGVLPEEVLPEYTHAFGDRIKLKSMSASTETFFQNNKLISRKTWECEIVPTATGEQEIGIISLGFFNADTGKYQVAQSEPVSIQVQSSTIRREMIEI